MCYVMLRRDLLSPGPHQKGLIDIMLKSAQNTIFTSFMVSKWIEQMMRMWCTIIKLMLLLLHSLQLIHYFEN